MPNFGLSFPWIAKYDPTNNMYSQAFKCGRAINTAITPNYNEASLFSDNQQSENVSEFKNATVSLGVDRMPVVAAVIMFGHTVEGTGEEISNTRDSSGYVGYGFVTAEMLDGVKKYRACVLPKVQFKEGEESYETKGESIVFKTPTLSGIAMANEAGEWRKKSPYYDTEEEADRWIQVELNALKKCAAPVASIRGGEHTGTLSVELETSTKDATIKYTINGTTPSKTNGVEYDGTPIEVTKDTAIRAITYKSGAESSDIMVEEYFITT